MFEYLNKLAIVTAVLLGLLFALPTIARGAEENCVQVYGGGVVCGVTTQEEHVTVPAGVGDNPAVLAGALLVASASLLYVSKRASKGNLSRV